jgi:hypothetical protein
MMDWMLWKLVKVRKDRLASASLECARVLKST